MINRIFYLGRLANRETGEEVASDIVFQQIPAPLKEVADALANFFLTEGYVVYGYDIRIYGPFQMDLPPQVYGIDPTNDGDPEFVATLRETISSEALDDMAAEMAQHESCTFDSLRPTEQGMVVSRLAGEAIEQAYPWGYRSEDSEP